MKSLLLLAALVAKPVLGSTMPENNLHLEDNLSIRGNVSQSEFNDMIDKAQEYYEPIVASHGGKLVIKKYWRISTVNATAEQVDGDWIVNMYGGMARRPELTKDAFFMVLCHEIGHHLAGLPQYDDWAAVEGQSDFFATHVCAKNMWKDEEEKNAEYADKVGPIAKKRCEDTYQNISERNLCFRTAAAGKSLASLLAYLSKSDLPTHETPDETVVSRTKRGHPDAQCRLDTYLAGALCTSPFDDYHIPGREGNRTESELDQLKYSCSQTRPEHEHSARRKCWYKQRVDDRNYD